MRRNTRRRVVGLASLVAVATLVVSSTVLAGTAGTVRGTARADTLRGGARADALYGLGGNDRLFGLGGNDKLYGGAGNDVLVGGPGNDVLDGGPGADTFSCGPGADVAVGGRGDRAGADCETKKGFPPVKPPPPPPAACQNGADDDGDGKVDFGADPGCTSSTDDDETDPPPPAKVALPGIYCGYTVQGPGICLTVAADGRSIERFETTSLVDCPNGERWQWSVSFSGRAVPLDADLSFAFSYAGPLGGSSGDVTNIVADEFVNGTLTQDGKATGTFALRRIAFDYQGGHRDCTQNPVGWNVARQG